MTRKYPFKAASVKKYSRRAIQTSVAFAVAWFAITTSMFIYGADLFPLHLIRDYNNNYYRNIPLLKGPYLSWQGNTSTTMTVSWETMAESGGVVFYGTSKEQVEAGTGLNVTNPESKLLHNIELTGLEPNTTYYYRIESTVPGAVTPEMGRVQTFRTGPVGFKPFSFAVASDGQRSWPWQNSRCNWVSNAIFRNELNHEDPADNIAFTLMAGDQFHWSSRADDIQRFFDQVQVISQSAPLMCALGNHDTRMYVRYSDGRPNLNQNAFKYYFAYPDNGHDFAGEDYHFIYANSYFLVLNITRDHSEANWNATRKEWFIDRLNESQAYDWTFVTFHLPVYCSQFSYEDWREELVPYFKQYGVDVVFTGHQHFYEHQEVDGIHYFQVAGAGGRTNGIHFLDENVTSTNMGRQYHYMRVSVESPTTMRFTTLSVTDIVMHDFTVVKGGA